MREPLEKLLAAGRDDALLRFSLGNACLKENDAPAAAEHFRRAADMDPDYSAAWKMLGRALEADGRLAEAAEAWEEGIAAARRRGDLQAGREMQVFLKRARRRLDGEDRL